MLAFNSPNWIHVGLMYQQLSEIQSFVDISYFKLHKLETLQIPSFPSILPQKCVKINIALASRVQQVCSSQIIATAINYLTLPGPIPCACSHWFPHHCLNNMINLIHPSEKQGSWKTSNLHWASSSFRHLATMAGIRNHYCHPYRKVLQIPLEMLPNFYSNNASAMARSCF